MGKRVHTKSKALSEDASWWHIFLSFYLGEVKGAGKDENIHEVDEALKEGDGSLHGQTLRRFNVLQFMLVVERGTCAQYLM